MRKEIQDIISQLPSGTASDQLTEGCLVLEGGAFRSLYTQGFLDVMMENDLNLTCVIGVSAGALAGGSYVSGQIGASVRTNLSYRHDGRYIGMRAILHSGSIIDVGFLTEDRGIHESLDMERFNRSKQRYVVVATNCLTGEATYFEKGKCDDILLAARASATIPRFSPMVMIDGVPYLDGACANKIPYRWALKEGYEKIVVIRTRDFSFRATEPKKPRPPLMYRKYPALAALLTNSDHAYNMECEELEALAARGRILHLGPSRPVEVGLMEPSILRLFELYQLGRQDALDRLDEIRAYLS